MFINEKNVPISTSIFSLPFFIVLLFLKNILSQCPPGMEQDGTCNIKQFCFDPKETCMNGICCQASKQGVIMPGPGGMPISQSPFCPIGSVPDGSCRYLQFCASPSEMCYMSTTCCKMSNDPSILGTSAGGIGGISSRYMSNVGQMGSYGMPGTMAGGMSSYGMGGIGMGMYSSPYGTIMPLYMSGGLMSPYDGMSSMGSMMGGSYGMMGGMGAMPLPCTDTQPQCMMFIQYCALQSILEACIASCNRCSGGMGGMMAGGMSGLGMQGYGMGGIYG